MNNIGKGILVGGGLLLIGGAILFFSALQSPVGEGLAVPGNEGNIPQEQSVIGSASRDLKATEKTGKNAIWVNKYSDARMFEIDENVRVLSATAEVEVVVEGYIYDTTENVIFKANIDVAEMIGLSKDQAILKDVKLERVVK